MVDMEIIRELQITDTEGTEYLLQPEPVDLTPYATTEAMNTAISTAVSSIETSVLKGRVDTKDELPTEGNKNGDIWIVGTDSTPTLEEYIYFEEAGAFEKFGSVDLGEIDLSNYYTKSAVDALFVTTNGNVTANATAISNKADTSVTTALSGRLDTIEADYLTSTDITDLATTESVTTALSGKTDNATTTAIADRVTALEDEPAVDLTPYATTASMTTAISNAITALDVASLKGRVDTKDDLPADSKNGDIYLVGLEGAANFAEYMYYEATDTWELLGTLSGDVNLANYYTKTEADAITDAIDAKIVAGTTSVAGLVQLSSTVSDSELLAATPKMVQDAVAGVVVPDATTTVKGSVQLADTLADNATTVPTTKVVFDTVNSLNTASLVVEEIADSGGKKRGIITFN